MLLAVRCKVNNAVLFLLHHLQMQYERNDYILQQYIFNTLEFRQEDAFLTSPQLIRSFRSR